MKIIKWRMGREGIRAEVTLAEMVLCMFSTFWERMKEVEGEKVGSYEENDAADAREVQKGRAYISLELGYSFCFLFLGVGTYIRS